MNSEPMPENPESPAAASSAVVKLDMDMPTARALSEAKGLVVVNESTFYALGKLGIEAGNYGLGKIAGGAIIMTLQGATEIGQELVAIVKAAKKEQTKIAAAFAYAANAKAIHGCAQAVNASGLANIQTEKKKKVVFGIPKVVKTPPSAAVG